MKKIITNNICDLAYTALDKIESEIFPKLCEEYGVEPELYTPETIDEYIKDEADYAISAERLVDDLIFNDNINAQPMTTKFYWDKKEKCMVHRIIVPYYNILDLICSNIDLEGIVPLDIEGIINFLELNLRREFGLVVFNTKYVKAFGIKKFEEYLNQFNSALEDFDDFCKDLRDDDDVSVSEFLYRTSQRFWEIQGNINISKEAKINPQEFIRQELRFRRQFER